ncbi:multicopper oxidase domain-containing protein [Streptantibioticus parmotrematis]|uniref:multicopper oxidase domain-containing protein n=1 Tax=Streptantibioticus parmotrematis TaxID=2873249 RepID=UPI0033DAA039
MVVPTVHSRRRVLSWVAGLGGGAIAAAPAPGPAHRAAAHPAAYRPVTVRPAAAHPVTARTRTYFVAADTVVWNYAPQGRNLVDGRPFDATEAQVALPGPGRLGPAYLKSRYRRYTDATFTERYTGPDDDGFSGILGPVIRARVGDTVEVVFRNNTPYPASMHPHGVFYTEANEGALYDDGSATAGKAGDAVAPGATFTYRWQVPGRAGPGPGDPSSVVWLYHDHSAGMGVPGVQAGLTGPIVVTRADAATADATPCDVDREVFALFTEFDENLSPYLKDNIARFGRGQTLDPSNAAFQNSNRKETINGYLFGNGPSGTTDDHPALTLERGSRVRWYVLDIGGARDAHTPHWHGNTVLVHGHREDVVQLLPATTVTADMRPDDPGIWLFHCHVDEHMLSGMSTRYRVL